MVAVAALGVSPAWADPVPVAARPLVVGTVLAADDVTIAEVEAKKLYPGTPRNVDDVVGKRLSRTLKQGDTFNTLTLKTANAVERNTTVAVVFKRPGIELSGSGLALDAGAEGKTIRVLNPESRTTLIATVSGPGTVTVGEVQ